MKYKIHYENAETMFGFYVRKLFLFFYIKVMQDDYGKNYFSDDNFSISYTDSKFSQEIYYSSNRDFIENEIAFCEDDKNKLHIWCLKHDKLYRETYIEYLREVI